MAPTDWLAPDNAEDTGNSIVGVLSMVGGLVLGVAIVTGQVLPFLTAAGLKAVGTTLTLLGGWVITGSQAIRRAGDDDAEALGWAILLVAGTAVTLNFYGVIG